MNDKIVEVVDVPHPYSVEANFDEDEKRIYLCKWWLNEEGRRDKLEMVSLTYEAVIELADKVRPRE